MNWEFNRPIIRCWINLDCPGFYPSFLENPLECGARRDLIFSNPSCPFLSTHSSHEPLKLDMVQLTYGSEPTWYKHLAPRHCIQRSFAFYSELATTPKLILSHKRTSQSVCISSDNSWAFKNSQAPALISDFVDSKRTIHGYAGPTKVNLGLDLAAHLVAERLSRR